MFILIGLTTLYVFFEPIIELGRGGSRRALGGFFEPPRYRKQNYKTPNGLQNTGNPISEDLDFENFPRWMHLK